MARRYVIHARVGGLADKGGIGPRRLETFEEHDIISDSTVFYTYKRQSESRSRSQRRAVSVGPGVGHEEDDEDLETVGIPAEGEADEDWTSIQRGRDRIPRSASALPGTHDGSPWHREGHSRRTSYDAESPLGPPPGLEALAIAERGPSPAYTPEARPRGSRRSSLHLNSNGTNPSQAPILSPIASAAPSRATSDRADSTSTERRFTKSPQGTPSEEVRHLPGVLEGSESEPGPSRPPPRPTILEGVSSRGTSSRRTSTSNVRFDETPPPPSVPAAVVESESDDHDELEEMHQSRRAASIRTNHSAESGATNGYHPSVDAVQAISTASTPAPSRPASIHARSSTEEPPASMSSGQGSGSSGLNGSRPSSTAIRDGRVSGLASATSSTLNSPVGSHADLRQITRAGRSARNGSATTIVIMEDNDVPAASAAAAAPPADSSARRASGSVRPGPSRIPPKRRESSEDRGRKFSLSAALRGLSQDVKDKVRQSSKSRTRGKSRTDSFSNAPPMPSGASAYATSSMNSRSGSAVPSRSGSAIPPRLVDDGHRSGRAISRDVTPPGEFVPPFGAGGAGRARSGSRDRTASPSSRSQSRGRGRNMGMKALTGKFSIGEGDEDEEDNEPVHHWKEFRKGEDLVKVTVTDDRNVQLPNILSGPNYCSANYSR
jgi:hypothetical protein